MTRPATCIAELRELARRRVPRAIFDYADGGAFDEVTLRKNRADFERLEFRQRVMIDVSRLSTITTVLGTAVSLPLAIAPTGLTGLFHRDGEIHGALAAEKAGIPFCLSTLSICSIEDVRSAVTQPFWMQIYLMRDRGFNRELIERARAAQCSALVLTVDLTAQGVRRRDVRNGLSIPPRLTFGNALDIAMRPRWALGVLCGKRRTFGNLESRLGATAGLQTLSEWIAAQFDVTLTWKDVEFVRQHWAGKLVIKGVLDVEDARQAIAAGCDGIVVSNHGGRQLDGAPSTISVLPEIADAVGDRSEILFDGGVQCGQDVLKAVALGARVCLIGKSFLYGLAAGGREGVARVLEILRRELEVSMALTGVTDIQRVDRSILRPGAR